MKHTECKDCELSKGDCGHHFKSGETTDYVIASLSACDKYGNCMFFKSKAKPDTLIYRETLKESIRKRLGISSLKYLTEQEKVIVDEIDKAKTVEPLEKIGAICNENCGVHPQELERLRLDNEVILRRLKHLLESKYISEFDKVDPVTKEYIKDIRSADRSVMYLCNREKPCKEHCRDLGHCKHTSDILYAKNFHRVEGATDREIYEEDDEHCMRA